MGDKPLDVKERVLKKDKKRLARASIFIKSQRRRTERIMIKEK